jgi:hypothetical protein
MSSVNSVRAVSCSYVDTGNPADALYVEFSDLKLLVLLIEAQMGDATDALVTRLVVGVHGPPAILWLQW